MFGVGMKWRIENAGRYTANINTRSDLFSDNSVSTAYPIYD